MNDDEKLIQLWSMASDQLDTVYRLRESLERDLPPNSTITHNFTNAWLPVLDLPGAQIVGHGIRLEIAIPSEKKLIVCFPAVANLPKHRIHCAALRQAQAFYKTRQRKAIEAKNKQAEKRRQAGTSKEEEYTKTDAQLDAELGAILENETVKK
jgi:hypothetical protein